MAATLTTLVGFFSTNATNLVAGLVTAENGATVPSIQQRGHTNLWVTDGTAATTIELTASNAYAYGLTPRDITTPSPSVLATPVACG
jgi:hypothetical protein